MNRVCKVSSICFALMISLLMCVFAIPQKAVNADTTGNWTNYCADAFANETTPNAGTEAVPYEISTAGQLALLAYRVASNNSTYADKYYKLIADIDLNGHYWDGIGTESYPFSGHFNGNNMTINDLNYTSTSSSSSDLSYGLFSSVTTTATITNCKLSNVDICITSNTVQNMYVGAIVGKNVATITNCQVNSGNLVVQAKHGTDTTKNVYVGGIAGYTTTNIVNTSLMPCNLAITLTGTTRTNNLYVGGCVGYSLNGNLQYLSASGNLISPYGIVGGIVGYTTSALDNCSSTKALTIGTYGANSVVGGIVGEVSGNTTISDCNNSSGGLSINDCDVGGIVGKISGSAEISNCTTSTSVTLCRFDTNQNYLGGIVGINSGTITKCVSNMTFNLDSSVTITQKQNYSIGGIVGSNNGTVQECKFGGNIYGITRANDVGGIAGINGTSQTITKCINNGNINGDGSVGGIVGTNNGSVNACANKGAINGIYDDNNKIGGISGVNAGTICDCVNSGNIGITKENNKYCAGISGGIVGSNSGSISYCYTHGSIESVSIAGKIVGGLVGVMNIQSSDQKLMNCYAVNICAKNDDEGYLGGVIGRLDGTYNWDSINTNIQNVYFNNEIFSTQFIIGNESNTNNSIMGQKSWDMVSKTNNASPTMALSNSSSKWTFGSVNNSTYSYPQLTAFLSGNNDYIYYNNSTTDQSLTPLTATIYTVTTKDGRTPPQADEVQHILAGFKATKPNWAFVDPEMYQYTVKYWTQNTHYVVDFETYIVNSDGIIIEAIWTAKVYNIKYYLSGTLTTTTSLNTYTTSNVPATHKFGIPSVLPTLSKTGYAFSGWYYNSDLQTDPLTDNTIDNTKYSTTDNIVVYGDWTAKTYNVTLNARNSDNTITGKFADDSTTKDKEVTFGQGFTFDIATPNDTANYVFAGWVDASNKLYTDKTGACKFNWNEDINETLNLYANFVDRYQKVYYKTSSGDSLIKSSENDGLSYLLVEYDTFAVNLSTTGLNSNKLDASNFPQGQTLQDGNCWYLDSALTNQFVFTTPITQTTTLYAKFRNLKFSVTFDKNSTDAVSGTMTKYLGEDNSSTNGIEYNSSILAVVSTLTDAIPSRIGYDFNGWLYNDTLLNNDTLMPSTEITLKADWKIKEFKIQLVSNYGTNTTNTLSTKINYGDSLVTYLSNIPSNNIPTQSGYGFVGWSLNSGSNYISNKNSTSDYIADFTMPDLTNLTPQQQSSITQLNNNTLCVYAVWHKQWTITFKTDATVTDKTTNNTVTSIAVWDGESVNIDNYQASLYGFIFEGWYNGRQLEENKVTGTIQVDKNYELTAKLSADESLINKKDTDMGTIFVIVGVAGGALLLVGIITIVVKRSNGKNKKKRYIADFDDDDDEE